jgi:2-iminobutanoate/2-iminopropanoate deaminase
MMAAVALLGFSGGQASAQQIVERFPSSGSAPASIVESVRVPPGAEMLILSGQTASRADAPDRPVSVDLPPAALGDTKTQTINILSKIRAALGRRGYALADVVKLTV